MLSITERNFYVWNAIITVAALSFLMWLLYFRPAASDVNLAASRLPAINAGLNATSTLLLLMGFWAIKHRRETLHKNLMLSACFVSLLFLASYVYYHSLQGDTKFLGEGWIRPVYFFILITHILLSMIMLPMILTTVFFGLRDRRSRHKKIARFTLPVWLYVSVTGVVIFFLLRNYS